ncbi:MAG: ABC transporter permease [Clostridia bacterium]|nr:ABC transporter permease [Clostridia bacterium]
MRFSDLLSIAFLNLWRRKLRTFLTILGMVIGVAAIVVMISLGLGIQESVLNSFAGAGSLTTIEVSSYNWNNATGGNVQETRLDDAAIETIASITGVKAVMPMQEVYGFLTSGKYAADITLLGVDMSNVEEFGFILSEGEFPEEYSGGSKYQIVFGNMTLASFINTDTWASAVDKITLDSRFKLTFDASVVYDDYGSSGATTTEGKSYNIEPVGVMSENNNEFAWYCLVDINALDKLAKQNKEYLSYDEGNYSQAYVKCETIDDVEKVKSVISEMGYGTYSLQDAVAMAQQQTDQIRYLLAAIGSVSLLIAAIGIMNTMMMSIYERTKEIGIIKVLGCKMSNIVQMFLAEAAYIGLFGGMLGLAASYGLSALLNSITAVSGFVGIIPPYLAIGAVVFSIAVALLSGIYPALRAMRLSPLTAIRNE